MEFTLIQETFPEFFHNQNTTMSVAMEMKYLFGWLKSLKGDLRPMVLMKITLIQGVPLPMMHTTQINSKIMHTY